MAFKTATAGISDLAGPVTFDQLRAFGEAWDSLWDESAMHASVLMCGEASSALDLLRELSLRGEVAPWDAVWVTKQSAGRGQHRRPWVSLPGNLHAAWAWPLVEPPGDDLVPLAVGLAVVRALRRFGVSAALKWPNDVLLGRRKLGGILVERYLDLVLVGLGLNIMSAPALSELHPDAAMPATCLAEHGLAFELGPFWDELCDEAKVLADQLGTDSGRQTLQADHAKCLVKGFTPDGRDNA